MTGCAMEWYAPDGEWYFYCPKQNAYLDSPCWICYTRRELEIPTPREAKAMLPKTRFVHADSEVEAELGAVIAKMTAFFEAPETAPLPTTTDRTIWYLLREMWEQNNRTRATVAALDRLSQRLADEIAEFSEETQR